MGLFDFLKIKKVKKREKTLEDYLEIARNEPDNTGVHMKIADIYIKRGEKEKGIREFVYAADAYAKEELFQLAISIYKTVLSIDENLINIYLTLAEIHQKQGFIGDAAATYERLAQNYLRDGKSEEAKRIIEKMVSLDPGNQFIHRKAEKFLHEITGVAPAPEAPRAVALVMEEKQFTVQPEEVTPRIAPPEEIVEEKGFFDLGGQLEDGQQLSLSADAQVVGDESVIEVDKVFDNIRQNIEERPKEEGLRLHYELGVAYQQMERMDEAIDEFKLAAADPEVKNECFRRLSACFREKEMYKESLNAANNGLKSRFISQNEFLGLHYEMGLTYLEMGENKKARKVLEEVEKINPGFKETKRLLEELKG